MTYATDTDVRNLLGTIGNRLPSWVVVATFREVAHSTVVDELAKVYPSGIPTFAGDGLTVARWAEAKLAAAEILEAVRVNLPDLGEAPDRLRDSALASLADGVVGYPAGTVEVDVDGNPTTPAEATGPRPRVSSFTSLSAFPDPYEAVRGSGFDEADSPVRRLVVSPAFDPAAATAAYQDGLGTP